MIKKKKIKAFGQIKKIDFDITLPMEFHTSFDMKKINMMVGPNGVGKSLILKCIWLFNMIAVIKLNFEEEGHKEEEIKSAIQFFFDNTFEDNNFHGKIHAFYPGGDVFVELDNGKVSSYTVNIQEQIKNIDAPIYMSTETRTFKQIETILKLLTTLEQDEFLKLYRTYDMLFAAMIEDKYLKEIIVDERIEESLKKFELDKHNMKSFIYKNEKFIFVNDKGEEKPLTMLSSGEQSLINMLLASY